MVGLKPLSLAILVLAGEALAAMQIEYRIKWLSSERQHNTRVSAGQSVPDIQVPRIKSNMRSWSQGRFTAFEEDGKLVVQNVKETANYARTSTVLDNMMATIRYNVPALGPV